MLALERLPTVYCGLNCNVGGPREGLLPLRKNRVSVSPAGRKRQLKGQSGYTTDFKNGIGCCLHAMHYEV